jgi:hypothetical protein
LLRYLVRHFLFFKNNLPTASITPYQSKKKGSFNSIAVRIRVKGIFKGDGMDRIWAVSSEMKQT